MTLETGPVEPAIDAAVDTMQSVAQAGDLMMVTVVLSPTASKRILAWPSWCGLEVEGERVVGLKAGGPEEFMDLATAAAAIGRTSIMLLALIEELEGVKGLAESVLMQLGSRFDVWRQRWWS